MDKPNGENVAPPPPSTYYQGPYAQPPPQYPVMQQPNFIVTQPPPSPKPQNYLVLAVLTTFCCNPLFGLIAWIFSCLSDQSYDEGDTAKARSRGRASMGISIAGIILSVILVIVAVVIYFVYFYKFINDAVKNTNNSFSLERPFCGDNYFGVYDCYTCTACGRMSSSYYRINCQDNCP